MKYISMNSRIRACSNISQCGVSHRKVTEMSFFMNGKLYDETAMDTLAKWYYSFPNGRREVISFSQASDGAFFKLFERWYPEDIEVFGDIPRELGVKPLSDEEAREFALGLPRDFMGLLLGDFIDFDKISSIFRFSETGEDFVAALPYEGCNQDCANCGACAGPQVPMQTATYGGVRRGFISSDCIREEMKKSFMAQYSDTPEKGKRIWDALNANMQLSPAISTHEM